MNNKLTPILTQKALEVARLQRMLDEDPTHPIARLMRHEEINQPPASFKKALQGSFISVIAEIKRQSPSKGILVPFLDPVSLAEQYQSGGASALSILTDKVFFGGELKDLKKVARVNALPILRKDFIIDKVQIAEAAFAGASAILCIVAALGSQLTHFITFAHTLNLDVLVEVHTKEELSIALDSGADIIGINNRNLLTLEVNPLYALELAKDIPSTLIKVAESGLKTPELVKKYAQAGFDAVLIGEALVTMSHPEQFIKACHE